MSPPGLNNEASQAARVQKSKRISQVFADQLSQEYEHTDKSRSKRPTGKFVPLEPCVLLVTITMLNSSFVDQ